MEYLIGAGAGLGLLLTLVGVVVMCVWTVLPFIILKTNRHLREIHAEALETNKWLKYVAEVTHEAEQRAGRS